MKTLDPIRTRSHLRTRLVSAGILGGLITSLLTTGVVFATNATAGGCAPTIASITIHKIDAHGKPLPDAVFRVTDSKSGTQNIDNNQRSGIYSAASLAKYIASANSAPKDLAYLKAMNAMYAASAADTAAQNSVYMATTPTQKAAAQKELVKANAVAVAAANAFTAQMQRHNAPAPGRTKPISQVVTNRSGNATFAVSSTCSMISRSDVLTLTEIRAPHGSKLAAPVRIRTERGGGFAGPGLTNGQSIAVYSIDDSAYTIEVQTAKVVI